RGCALPLGSRGVRLGGGASPRNPILHPPLRRREPALRKDCKLLRPPLLGLRHVQRASLSPTARGSRKWEDPVSPHCGVALLQADLRERCFDSVTPLPDSRCLPRHPHYRRGGFSALR